MDASELEPLVARLVENPHDEEALAYAHAHGESDPQAYAVFLERVGNDSPDPAYAAHWLAEAANVWAITLADAHRAARVLMNAIERDPTHRVAAERLANLYREKGDVKALAGLLDHRAKAMLPLAGDAGVALELAAMHEELAQLFADPAALAQPHEAIEHWRKAAELDPGNAFAIFSARELLKSEGRYEEALPLYGAELALEQDLERRLALLRDEAASSRLAGDLRAASRALHDARRIDPDDAVLRQEYASSVLERVQGGQEVDSAERRDAVRALVGLAQEFGGEHAVAYGGAALDIEPGSDEALGVLRDATEGSGQDDILADRYRNYLAANPDGEHAREARALVGDAEPPRAEEPSPIPPRAPTVDVIEPSARRVQLSDAVDEAGNPATLGIDLASLSGADRRVPPVAATEADPLAMLLRDAAPAAGRSSLQGILEDARMLVGKSKKSEAHAKYKDVLDTEPAHPEALAWVEDYLRSQRNYAELRDVLLASVSAPGSQESIDSKKERLREVAGLCEGNLRDTDGAVAAWRQLIALDRSDESARTALTRLLERTQRWDDLANLLEQEATVASDIEIKVALEKKLAKLQEDRRKDLIGAAEAWVRIARLTPEEDAPVSTAAKLYERASRSDLAASILAEHTPRIEDAMARGNLLERLGQLRETLDELEPAGDAYAEAADLLRSGRLWDEAERTFSASEQWGKAAHAAEQKGQLVDDPKQIAQCLARAGDYFAKAGDEDLALEKLESATNLDPLNDDYANQLAKRFDARGETERLVNLLSKRGDRLSDRDKRISTRRQAAQLASSKLRDPEFARELWLKMLEDGDDKEALERLIDDAVGRSDHTEATTLLRRLSQGTTDRPEKALIALREAELLASGVGDVDTALSRYEEILLDLDSTSRPALQAIADLQERRGETVAATDALERELKLVADTAERGQIAGRLARLYETRGDAKNAIRSLDLVRKADPEDFDALERLCDLCEQAEQWDRVAELLAERIEVEGDEDDAATMTRRLAQILADELDRGDEALAVLTELADGGDAKVRDAYVDLGDRRGQKGIVAAKLVEWWFDARHTPERQAALVSAFSRFVEVGHDTEAVRVAIELVRTRGADRALAEKLEELSVKTADEVALTVAHDMLAREFIGAERGKELVRQAEIKVQAGVGKEAAFEYGEEGLSLLTATDAEPYLERVALLAPKPADVVDLYERQVSRAKAPADRARALARAAQIAVGNGQPERARSMFELALAGAPADETVELLENAARDGDALYGGDKLRRTLATSLSAGGQGARDGGRTRAALLRRAALFSHRDLVDVDQAFRWLGESLIAHVDLATLDELDKLGIEIGDPRRTESALTHAMGEVYDGPLVRQLLARRAKLRLEQLADKPGAAADLKKLHDLSPQDHGTLEELAGLLIDLGDFKALVALYEDQILRGRDVAGRAEFARKVARVWEEQLQDAREAADAWRRVMRMKAGDEEATGGLERAKTTKLRLAEPATIRTAYAPPLPNPDAEGAPRSRSNPPATAPGPSAKGTSTRPPVPSRASGRPSAGPPAAPRVPSNPPPPLPGPSEEEAPHTVLGGAVPPAVGAAPVPPAAPTSPLDLEDAHAAPADAVDSQLDTKENGPVQAPALLRPAVRKQAASPFRDERGGSILDEEIAASLEKLGAEPRPSAPPPVDDVVAVAVAVETAADGVDAADSESEDSEATATGEEQMVDLSDVEEVEDGELVDDDDLLEIADDQTT